MIWFPLPATKQTDSDMQKYIKLKAIGCTHEDALFYINNWSDLEMCFNNVYEWIAKN